MTPIEARRFRKYMRDMDEARESVRRLPVFKALSARIPAQAGGGEVSPHPHDILYPQWLDVILNRGQPFGPPVKVLGTAPPSGCHFGTVETFVANPKKYRIATGFYAFSDKLWRRHSWLIQGDTTDPVETTKGRPIRYFGAILNPNESPDFVAMVLDGNLPSDYPLRERLDNQLRAIRGPRYSYFHARLK